MNLRALYAKEREGIETIEVPNIGYAEYKIINKECYISDIFVVKQHRNVDVASAFADKITDIAKQYKCEFLTGSVSPQAINSTASMKVLLAYGFEVLKSSPEIIWFIKRL